MTHRSETLLTLTKNLQTNNTPTQIIEAISFGFNAWHKKLTDSTTWAHAPMAGSPHGPDMLLSLAFTEQFCSIGWTQLLHGRVSKYWSKAYSAYMKSTLPNQSAQWATGLIHALWTYTHALWAFWNKVVHGHDDQEVAHKIRQDLLNKVSQLYVTF